MYISYSSNLKKLIMQLIVQYNNNPEEIKKLKIDYQYTMHIIFKMMSH